MSDAQHQQRQQRLKEKVDARIAQAQREQGILMIFTGNGKGKTTAAMGTATRAVGHQSVIITGRGCHRQLIELADTVTEMRPIKHAFDSGIKAQKGIDW